ncbi:MAG TPA: ATP synthase F1 subunit gamma [Lachnospiraceae bacterium]|nr:ATP synthase F1 subunit gamma [Lachnospiraceae bacterium]
MANAKELQNRIKSVKDTMKITKAMYMMSSMKVQKAKQKLSATEPYFFTLQQEIADILLHFPDMQHVFFDNRESDEAETIKKKAVIVFSGDKGMAGGYHHNLYSEAERYIKESEDCRVYALGEVGRRYLKMKGYRVDETFRFSVTNPSIHRARYIAETLMDAYLNDEIDEVTVVYTRMVNTMNMKVDRMRLLPLETHDFMRKEIVERVTKGSATKADLDKADEWYLFEPSPKNILEKLARNYVTGSIYGALVEAYASEENSRTMAMKSATDAADKILTELSMEYNQVRQAAITQEITEVVGGAKALLKKKQQQLLQGKAG